MVDECVYHKFSGSKHIFLVLYVVDILLATNDIGLLHKTNIFNQIILSWLILVTPLLY